MLLRRLGCRLCVVSLNCRVRPLVRNVAYMSAPILLARPRVVHAAATTKPPLMDLDKPRRSLVAAVWHWLRLVLRRSRLIVTFGPLIVFYPLTMINNRFYRAWLSLLFLVVERSGPAIIKLFQWASTRRDLFSDQFCSLFGALQRRTRPRPWKETEQILKYNFGPEWGHMLMDIEHEPVGSGCVAQVFKARTTPEAFVKFSGLELSDYESQEPITVAVKVAHPTVLSEIELDLDVMASVAYWASFIPSFKYLNPIQCMQQFRYVMERQTDLRHEGRALLRFRKAFANDRHVAFPEPLGYSNNVLIETFEEGEHVSNYMTASDTDIRHLLAVTGVEAVFKMIFSDNYVHGDLHPGNILVKTTEIQAPKTPVPKIRKGTWKWLMQETQWVRRLLYVRDSEQEVRESGPKYATKLIFLDTGITTELSGKDLKNIRSLFRAVVLGQGEEAGQMLLDQAPQHNCEHPENFRTDIANLVRTTRSNLALGSIQISSLLTDLFAAARNHRVGLEPNFTSVILAVMVLEGLGRSLDPDLDLLETARPFLI